MAMFPALEAKPSGKPAGKRLRGAAIAIHIAGVFRYCLSLFLSSASYLRRRLSKSSRRA